MGVKHTVLPDGQAPTVAFSMLAQLCGQQAKETEIGALMHQESKNGQRKDLPFLTKDIS